MKPYECPIAIKLMVHRAEKATHENYEAYFKINSTPVFHSNISFTSWQIYITAHQSPRASLSNKDLLINDIHANTQP